MKHFQILFIVFALIIPGTGLAATSPQKLANQTMTVMVYGDSLSANYGIPTEAGWVALLEKRLHTKSPALRVVNASISGETTLGGLNRIEQALKTHRPDIIILGLGANDGLRGSSINTIYKNLAEIIEICLQNNTAVLLAGMQLPPNYGMTYTRKFRDLYPQLAENYQTGLIPFLLDGFGEKQDFFQPDGIHPTAEAQKIVVENVWQVLQTMLQNHFAAISSQGDL